MRLTRRLTPILLFLLAVAVMSFRLGGKSLWNDEAFSYFVARRGPAAAVRFIAQDTQPPVYYLLLSWWLHLGHGPRMLRALSVLALALAILPLHGAARRLCDRRTATVACLLFALTPLMANWAQKARPYAMQTLFLALAYWGFAVVFRAPAARQEWIGQGLVRALRQRRPRAAETDLGWLAGALGGALAMLTQQPAGFFLLGLNVTVALAALADLRANRRWLLNWTVSQLLLIAVWLLWLPWFLAQIRINLTPAQIAVRHLNFLVSGWGVVSNLESVFGITSLWRAAGPALALQLGIALLGAGLLIRARRALPVLVPLAVPVLTCVLGFWFIHPVFGYVIIDFLFLWLPYSVLLASAIVRLRPRPAGLALFAALLAADAWGLRNYYATPNQPTAQVAAVVAAHLRPGDGVVLSQNAAMRWTLAYYLGPARRRELIGLNVAREWDFNRLLRTPAQALAQRRDFVVLPGGEPSAVAPALLARHMRLLLRQRIGTATVLLFARPGAGSGA